MVSRGLAGSTSEAAQLQQQASYAFRVIGQQIRQAGSMELALSTNTASTSKVPYKLYQDSARTAEWDAANLLSKTGNGKDQAIPVYAKLAGDTNVEAGSYADTVVATVTY